MSEKLTLAEIEAMHKAGQLRADPAAPEADLPDAFWAGAKVVPPRAPTEIGVEKMRERLRLGEVLRRTEQWALIDDLVKARTERDGAVAILATTIGERDALLAARDARVREQALREAAAEAERTGTCLLPSGHFLSERCRDAILALIK